MSRRTNPLAIVVLVVVAVVALAVAIMVKNMLPPGAEQFSGLIFWGIVIGIGALGSVLAGKFLNR